MKSLFELTLPTSPLERTARDLAEYAHRKLNKTSEGPHLRRFTSEPYANHLAEVVGILRTIHAPPRMLAAAWLHDTGEDTRLTNAEVRKAVGHKVADMVQALTDTEDPTRNRAQRKEDTRARLALAGFQVQTIKLADILSNVPSIAKNDPKFATVYVPEAALLLDVLALRGHPRLWLQAKRAVDQALAGLATN